MSRTLIQLYRFSTEAPILSALLAAGHRTEITLWSNLDYPARGFPLVPLIRNGIETAYLKNLETVGTAAYGRIQETWNSRIDALAATYFDVPYAYDVHRNIQLACLCFDSLEIDHFLCWGGLEPWYGIPLDVARQRNIPSQIIERGLLPNTLMIDPSGIAGFSSLTGQSLGSLVNSRHDDYARHGAEVLRTLEETTLWKMRENTRQAVNSPRAKGSDSFPRVLVMGCLDRALGIHYEAGFSGVTLPGFHSGYDLAKATATALGIPVIFRPHPNEPPQKSGYKSQEVHFTTANLIDSIRWADVIVGYGSTTDLLALAMGKPVVLAGRSQLTGKEIAYEASGRDDLAETISEALVRKHWSERTRNLSLFMGYLALDYLYALKEDGLIRKTMRDCSFFSECDSKASKRTSSPHDAANSILSETGRRRVRELAAIDRAENSQRLPENVSAYARDWLERKVRPTLVLDFDNTFFLGNSTELFIEKSRPRLLAECAAWLGLLTHSILLRLTRRKFDKDALRVCAVAILLPWSLPLWRRSAKKHASRKTNTELAALLSAPERQALIVSFGFRELIAPLLRHMLPNEALPAPLIASSIWHPAQTLRATGKVAAIEHAKPDLDWRLCLAISDSLEDSDLLSRSEGRCLCYWPIDPPAPPAYFPFRYTIQAKFADGDYFTRVILGQDFSVALLTFGSTVQAWPGLAFLFVSFFCIYEVGYYENDHFAARTEKFPQLHPNHIRFSNFPISRWAWIWATALGAIGIAILPNSNPWHFAAWLAALSALRIVFAVYNRCTEKQRTQVYPLLQLFKNYGLAAVLVPSLPGLLLGAGHALQQSVVYFIYRFGGNPSEFKRERFRLLFFCVAAVVAACWQQSLTWLLTINGAFIVLWLSYQALVELRGKTWSLGYLGRSLRRKLISPFVKR